MQWPILHSAAALQDFFERNIGEIEQGGGDFVGFFESLYQQLNFTVAPDGFVIPSLTTEEINNVLADPSKSTLTKMVYNNQTEKLLFNVNGVFKEVNLL